MTATAPTEEELVSHIAADTGTDAQRVREILAQVGISLRPPIPAHRQMTLQHLYVEGIKSGVKSGTNGPFHKNVSLKHGSWAIASRVNSAGKSSLLWALVFAVRGASDDSYERPECFSWFKYIRVDLEVSGVAASIRLRIEDSHTYSAALLTAESTDQLTALSGRQEEGAGVRLVDEASGPEQVTELIGRFMMERLGLRPLDMFTTTGSALAEKDGPRDGTMAHHQWPAYFPMIGLSSASDSTLFGKTAIGQLPTRLMQVFLDVPFVVDVMTADAYEKLSSQKSRHTARRAEDDAEVRRDRFGDLRIQLESARRHLASLQAAEPVLESLRHAARAAQIDAVAGERQLAEARIIYEQARSARLEDQRLHRELSESAAARTLFAALNPHACPRCDTSIDDLRRARESTKQLCAVCNSDLQLEDDNEDDRRNALAELEARLAASREAEQRARQHLTDSENRLTAAETRRLHIQGELDKALSTDVQAQLGAAAHEVARLEGAVEVIDQLNVSADAPNDDHERVLGATKKILSAVAAAVTSDLFAELNNEIVTLAQELGVSNLDSVALDRAGRLNARKSGKQKTTPFKKLSPGDRVRLRIAIIISLMTVGRRHGINSHPGLLLIDSPADVEMEPGDVKLMLERLRQLGQDTSGLQVIITTSHDAVWDVFPPDSLIVGEGGKHLF